MSKKQGLDILQAALESATEESIKSLGPTLLDALLAASAGNPVAAVIASVAKAVIRAVFHTTSSLEKKLDLVLSEPMLTAATTLDEVLSVEATTEEEHEECERLLTRAADNLAKAYTYAKKSEPSRCKDIRAYQALVAALRRGGRPFVARYSQELLDEASAARKKSTTARDEAEAIRSGDFDAVETLRREWDRGLAISHVSPLASAVGFKQMLVQRASFLSGRADQMDRRAEAYESFCAFVQLLASRRADVLAVSISDPGQ